MERSLMSLTLFLHIYKYERYLRSSGGAFSRASGYNLSLQPMKSLPMFKANKEPLIVMDTYTKQKKAIPMLYEATSTKIIGVWLQPDNNQSKQLTYIMDKVKSWTMTFGNSHLPPYHKLLSFKTRLCAQIDYSSPILMVNKNLLNELSKPFLPVLKHSLGLAHSYSTDLLYLDKKFGGYHILNLWLRSLSTKMEMIITFE